MPLVVRRRQFLIFTMIGVGMWFGIDGSMINLAMPEIRADFAVDNGHMSWVASAHMLSFMAMTPCVGWLCVKFGRREVFCVSLAVLSIATPINALASSFSQLVVLRVVEGLSVGVVFPLTVAILLDQTADSEHSKVITWWTTGSFVGPLVGTIATCALVDRFGWRSIFVFQSMLCFPLFIGSLLLVQRGNPRPARSVKVLDLIAAVGSIMALQYFLIRGFVNATSGTSLLSFGACVGCIMILTRNVRAKKESLINIELFSDENFASSMGLLFLVGFEAFSLGFIVPLLLADTIGADSSLISLLTIPRMISTAIGAATAGRLVRLFGFDFVTSIGFGLIGLGSITLLASISYTNSAAIAAAGVLHGVGVGLCSTTLGIRSFATLPELWRNEGSAIRQLSRFVGGAVGIATLIAASGGAPHGSSDGYFTALLITAAIAAAGSILTLSLPK